MLPDFKPPKAPDLKEKTDTKRPNSQKSDGKLPSLGENTEFVGDASAVNKDGYVHQHMLNVLHPSSNLTHLSYFCPGLHGKGTRQDIRRKTFGDILKEERYIIPIIQRRYCWDNKLIHRWYTDIRRGTRDHLGIHNTGNLVVKWSQTDRGFVLIDGQQRVTTTLLFLAALRDVILEEFREVDESVYIALVGRIRKLLVLNSREETDRLIPCYLDRDGFYSVTRRSEAKDQTSFQVRSYTVFQTLLKEDFAKIKHVQDKINLAEEIFYQSISKMGVTFCNVLNEINMGQVFLWLQEKSLLSEDLLQNNSPGLALFTCDLVRNLLLSPVLDQSMKEQEDFYLNHWLHPLEARFSNRSEFNIAVKQYIDSRHNGALVPSALENQMAKMQNTGSKMELIHYSKFVTFYENFHEQQPFKSVFDKSVKVIDDMKKYLSLETR